MDKVSKHLAFAGPGVGKRMQNPFTLDLPIPRKRPAQKGGIDQQTDAVSLIQQRVRQRSRGLYRILKQRMTACKFIRPQTAVEHDSHIRYAFLLKFVGVKLIDITRACAPVDGAWRITGLVFTYAEEICACAACPSWDRSGIDASPPWADCHLTNTRHWREDEQPSLRLHTCPGATDR